MNKIFLPILTIILFSTTALAAPQMVTETYTYILGDSDSKIQARRVCLQEAKRRALERVGTLITSYTKVEDGRLSTEEIKSYTSSFIKINDIKEKWSFSESGSMIVKMTVGTSIDPEKVRNHLDEIKKNKPTPSKREYAPVKFSSAVFDQPTKIEFPDGTVLTFSKGVRRSVAQKVCRFFWRTHDEDKKRNAQR